MNSTPQHCRPCAIPRHVGMHHFLLKPAMPLILMLMYASLQCWCILVLVLILLGAMANLLLGYYIFFYAILDLQVLNLICYIVTLLWYARHCYNVFVLQHCFDILYCRIALIYYIALICYILLYCFDMLHFHIALICYTSLHCFYSATFLCIWIHTTFLNDESGLSEMSVATLTDIIILRFQLWTV
jgi:hypothetical protein